MSSNRSVPSTVTAPDLDPPRLRYVFYVSTSPPVSVHEWRVVSLTLDEQLHAPYELRVSAVPDADFEDEALLNARVTLEIHRGEATRRVHGVVLEHVRRPGCDGEPIVELRAGPALALLGVHRRSRVIQHQTIPELARMVLEPHLDEHGSRLVLDRLTGSYEPVARCVQHLDTDLAFVLARLAEAGIALLFHHGAGSESVVLVDDERALPPCGCEPLDVGPDDARSYVDGDRHVLVLGLRATAINEDDHLTVLGDHQETIAGNASHDVRGMLRIRVRGERDEMEPSKTLTSPSMVTTIERGTFEVDAADGIVLRCGASRIELRPDRILIVSPCIVGPTSSLDMDLSRGRKTLLD